MKIKRGEKKRKYSTTNKNFDNWETGRGWFKDCTQKQKFPDKIEADLYAIMYNNQRALMFSPVEAYSCDKHNCWHIGHSFEKKRVKKDGL